VGHGAVLLTADASRVLAGVKLVVLDAEGCLTDGLKMVTESGESFLRYSAIDGLGVWLLSKTGVRVVIVSASSERSIEIRSRQMGAELCALNVGGKAAFVRELCLSWDVPLDAVCAMGDDYWDLEVMSMVGVSVCPATARPEVLEVAAYRTRAPGGNGAVRELADRILAAKGLALADILKLLSA
jgi:3-deoxy-D-manno-octulosonate 8-phosphate phosphatase (KDO 8-P phosphatase)